MLESLFFSLNTVTPIFLIVIVGALLGKMKFLTDDFLSVCDKLVFNVCLPCLVFKNIVTADLGESLDLKLIIYCSAAVLAIILVLCLTVPIFIRDNAKRGAFVQGAFRSNSAILGITLAENMFPGQGEFAMAMVIPFVVFIYNAFAVVVLSIFAPTDGKLTPKQFAAKILKTIIHNPHIISIALAFLWLLVFGTIPADLNAASPYNVIAYRSLDYLASIAAPLALISLGASFKLESLKGRIGAAIAGTVVKIVIVPFAAVVCGVMMGFSGISLGVILVIFGSPSAISCYVMAKQMKSDHELAAQIMLISTLFSTLTLFLGIFILREMGLI